MPRTARRTRKTTGSLAELIHRLGDVPLERIPLHPAPGRATEEDLLWYLDNEDRLFELVDGVLVEKVMGLRESALAVRLGGLMNGFAGKQDLGFATGPDGTMRLMPHLVRIPDVAFISWDQLPERYYPDEPIPDLVPKLAVEVLSEGNTPGEMNRKLSDYFRAGTKLVWFIDPDARTVTVFHSVEGFRVLKEPEALEGDKILPGFRLPLQELFAFVKPLRKPTRKNRKTNGKNGK